MAKLFYIAELGSLKFAISEHRLAVSATLLTSGGELTTISKSAGIEGLNHDAIDATVARLMNVIKAQIEHDHDEAQA
jgi:hypothetical protein